MNKVDAKLLQNKVESINALPTIPATMKRLSTLIEKPKITLEEISRFVGNDPALTVKVLKMVNSALYGFPGRISSVSHATMLLGLNMLKGLLLGISVFEMMQKSMAGLWEHSVSCAVTSRIIAKRKGLKEPDEASVAGLLHDIGKVILLLEFPKEYEGVIKISQEKEIAVSEAESVYFAETHASVGRFLTEKWRFPGNLTETIACHHKPHLAQLAPMETAIVHFSDILVRARGLGFAGDYFVPAVNPASFDMLQLSEKDIGEILREVEDSAGISEGMAF